MVKNKPLGKGKLKKKSLEKGKAMANQKTSPLEKRAISTKNPGQKARPHPLERERGFRKTRMN